MKANHYINQSEVLLCRTKITDNIKYTNVIRAVTCKRCLKMLNRIKSNEEREKSKLIMGEMKNNVVYCGDCEYYRHKVNRFTAKSRIYCKKNPKIVYYPDHYSTGKTIEPSNPKIKNKNNNCKDYKFSRWRQFVNKI